MCELPSLASSALWHRQGKSELIHTYCVTYAAMGHSYNHVCMIMTTASHYAITGLHNGMNDIYINGRIFPLTLHMILFLGTMCEKRFCNTFNFPVKIIYIFWQKQHTNKLSHLFNTSLHTLSVDTLQNEWVSTQRYLFTGNYNIGSLMRLLKHTESILTRNL